MPAPKTPSKTPTKADLAKSAPEGDAILVRQLADILNDTSLTEIEVERSGLKIRVSRTAAAVSAQPIHYAAPAPAPVQAAAPTPSGPTPVMSTDPAGPSPAAGEEVKSPMVGTVYLQATPGSDPFIAIGDTVKKGQTLLIIEAMKTMNPIAAPRDGKVLSVIVGDAQPVEFGEALLILE